MFQHALLYYSDHFAIFQKDLNNKASVKRKSSSENTPENVSHQVSPVCSPIDLKYRMHLCYKELKQLNSAINTLQSIPKESVIFCFFTTNSRCQTDNFIFNYKDEFENFDCTR